MDRNNILGGKLKSEERRVVDGGSTIEEGVA
jgi:hypothetical protein